MGRIFITVLALFLALIVLAHAQRPAGQIVPGPTGTTGTLFWDQKGESLGAVQGYTYRYYIDSNTTPIAMSASCTDVGTAPMFACSAAMTTLASGPHDYTLELLCSGCVPTSVKALPITYNNAGNAGLVAPTGLRVESSSGSQIPPLASIVDSAGATWTQGPSPAACPPSVASSHPPSDCAPQMRNGTVVGLGSSILYKNATVYVQGPSGSETHWWKYNGPNDWTDVGTAKP